MAGETLFLLHAFLMGVFITFVYDLLRIFRRVIPHASFFVSLEDLGFWVYCGGEVFLLMYRESDGKLRWFAVFGAFLGMFLYKKLVSGWFVKYVSLILKKALGFLGKALGFACRPFCFLGRMAGRGVRRAGGGLRRMARRWWRAVKNRLTVRLKMFKINLRS